MTVGRVSPRYAPLLRIRAIARRHAYVVLRSPHRLFDITVWPLVDALLFGSIAVFFAGQDGGGVGRVGVGYLLAGIVLWHVIYQSEIAVSTGFLEETWSRNLLSLMVTPLRPLEMIAGVALFGMVKLIMGVGAVALVAASLYAFDVTDMGLGLVPVVALLLTVGWSVGLFVIGLVLRFGSGAEAFAWGILFVLMPLSGVFYPVESLPSFLRPIAQVLPTTYAFDAGRSLIERGSLPWDRVGLAGVAAVLFAALALAFFARMLDVFRRRGLISRYN